MLYNVEIRGISPLIMHSDKGLDPKLPANLEKADIIRKRGSNRTDADIARLAELDCLLALWVDANESPTIPATAIRANIEKAARTLKQGPQVRGGVIVASVTGFDFDTKRYGTSMESLGQTTQFSASVVVQRSRIMRTRAKFDLPWGLRYILDCEADLVDKTQLETWLDIGGRRVGLGDWRPEKSGHYGRYELVAITQG